MTMAANGEAKMEVDAKPAADLRLLAVFCNPEEEDPGYDPPGPGSTPTYVASRPGAQVEIMDAPSMAELAAKLEQFRPTILYIRGSPGAPPDNVKGHLAPIYIANGPDKLADHGDLVSAMEEVPLDTVFLDAAAQEKFAELLRLRGIRNVIFWAEDPTALVAAHFASAFFGSLSLPRASVIEAYTLALYSVQAQCGTKLEGKIAMPSLPDLLLGPPPPLPGYEGAAGAAGGGAAGAAGQLAVDEGAELELPDNTSVPPLGMPGVELLKGLAEAVPGWGDCMVQAPRVEARLLLAGGSGLLDAYRLAYLGEGLRSLLVIEARAATIESADALDPPPPWLGEQSLAGRRVGVRTASGARVSVTMVAPEAVLGNEALRLYALRQALTADCMATIFRLPPAGTPLPMPKASDAVLAGTPVVESLAVTSVWAVHALRQLAQMPLYRGLLALGVAAVGSAVIQGVSDSEVLRRKVIITGVRPSDGGMGGRAGGANGPSTNPLAIPADPPLPPHCCGRAAIHEVAEEEFVQDLMLFLGQRRGKPYERSKFPDAVLNGGPLDVYVLYKEVVTRGGFRVGNGINWKGQVFAKMRNWTANNRQTGVGAALKKHYANILWEYEQAHPADVLSDRCIICGSGEEQGLTDWIACDSCESWVHFSCDRRQGLGSFASYSGENGRTYTCPSCTRNRGPPGGGSASGGRGSDDDDEDDEGEEGDEGEDGGGGGDDDDGGSGDDGGGGDDPMES